MGSIIAQKMTDEPIQSSRSETHMEARFCAKKARDVQWCLARSNHKEKYCVEVIQVLKDCIAHAEALEAEETSQQGARRWLACRSLGRCPHGH